MEPSKLESTKLNDIIQSKILLLDGATGTELARRGMPGGVCPEQWVLEHPEAMIDIQRAYVDAGSRAVYACTFGGNRFKLAEFGLEDQVSEMNKKLVQISKDAVGDKALVLGDMAPTGRFVEPFGDLGFEEAVACYKEQAEALLQGGVDGFVIETMMDLQEARAALIAVKETCDLPVLVSMTFGAEGRTLNGTDPLSALITFQSLGAAAVGCNCSTGPEEMIKVVRQIKPYATVPLLAKPNAGMPKLRDGVTVFDMTPEEFGDFGPALVEAGVNVLGGCCGTSPAYIKALSQRVGNLSPTPPVRSGLSAVCSYRRSVLIGPKQGLTVIGEAINPSGKKSLTEELREGRMQQIKQSAATQEGAGADLIDVNVHVSGTDEAALMRQATTAVALSAGAPIAVDTLIPDAVEQALRVYPGRALLNSISNRTRNRDKLFSLARKYGSMVVLMPLDDDGVPESADLAQSVALSLLDAAESAGIHRDDCLVDCLVFPASKGAAAFERTSTLVKWCNREAKVSSLAGISNLTFGLEERQWLDGTLLCMLASLDLTAAFIDTACEHTRNMVFACDALAGRDPKFSRYLERFSKKEAASSGPSRSAKRTPAEAVFDAVMQGDEEGMSALIEKALAANETARALVDDRLIPAINLVGEKFDKKEYFLPQLIASADAMRKGFETLEPHLAADGGKSESRPKVLLATVQGDIHDIGKNIVGLMLKNYSFEVIDLGKDVSAETIIREVKQHNASIVGLSALMTTTMVEMKNVIDLARSEGLGHVKFMIGGAVVDQPYADEIGAQGFAADALAAVRLAKEFGAE